MKRKFVLLIIPVLLGLTGNAQVKSITKGDTLILHGDTIAIKGKPKVIIMKASELDKNTKILQFRMDSLQQLFLDKELLIKNLDLKIMNDSILKTLQLKSVRLNDSILKIVQSKSFKLHDSIMQTFQLKSSKMIDSIVKKFQKSGEFDSIIKNIQKQSILLQKQSMIFSDSIIKQFQEQTLKTSMKLRDSILKSFYNQNGKIFMNLSDSTLFRNIRIFDIRVDSLKTKLKDNGIIFKN